MRTIEEILYALECGVGEHVGFCNECAYHLKDCVEQYSSDAAKLIRQLEHERNRFADENLALRTELKVNLENPYWVNICKLNAKQEIKGKSKYGVPLEENTTLTRKQRIEHLEEEMIDGLKYCEHLKAIDDDGITANDYQRAAMRTAGDDKESYLLNGVMGLCWEAGEVIDLVKKHLHQGHEFDPVKVVDELGDVLWYATLISEAVGATLSEVMERNIDKLKERYPEGFDKARSIHREENDE